MALQISRPKRNKKHGAVHNRILSREYMAWHNAKRRCLDPKATRFDLYGGRGVTMFVGWVNDFPAFLAYVGPCPDGHSLDRFPNGDGNYEPGNVRWATQKQQMSNMSRNRYTLVDGERVTISEASRRLGVPINTLKYRLKKAGLWE